MLMSGNCFVVLRIGLMVVGEQVVVRLVHTFPAHCLMLEVLGARVQGSFLRMLSLLIIPNHLMILNLNSYYVETSRLDIWQRNDHYIRSLIHI